MHLTTLTRRGPEGATRGCCYEHLNITECGRVSLENHERASMEREEVRTLGAVEDERVLRCKSLGLVGVRCVRMEFRD